ncbi:hypothetical protein V2J09_011136 [Rumex salicifolius]
MPSKKKNSNESVLLKDSASVNSTSDDNHCFEGESLSFLLKSIRNAIESEKKTNKAVPEKLWYKQHFAMGVNEVTRILERMPSGGGGENTTVSTPLSCPQHTRFSVSANLQAVLVASDCNPRWLTKHLSCLAASRGVPLVHIKDRKEGSLRLGELVKLKTAIAIGVKAKGKNINMLFEEILGEGGQNSWMGMSSCLHSVTESAALLTTI